jgi:hypothetical protein
MPTTAVLMEPFVDQLHSVPFFLAPEKRGLISHLLCSRRCRFSQRIVLAMPPKLRADRHPLPNCRRSGG